METYQSPICMIAYSLEFLLRYLGFVWPTWSIYLAMGRGALWWVWSYGAWSQLQKWNRHVCIVATKDKKTGSISATIDKRILSTSCHRSYCITPFFHELNTLDACWIMVMCGVIVVDAGRSRSTNLGRDAYIIIIAWISSWLFEVLSIAQQ